MLKADSVDLRERALTMTDYTENYSCLGAAITASELVDNLAEDASAAVKIFEAYDASLFNLLLRPTTTDEETPPFNIYRSKLSITRDSSH